MAPNSSPIQEIVAQFCRAPEAIKLSGLPEKSFWNHVHAGRIPCYRLSKSVRSRLFKISEVLEAVQRNREQFPIVTTESTP